MAHVRLTPSGRRVRLDPITIRRDVWDRVCEFGPNGVMDFDQLAAFMTSCPEDWVVHPSSDLKSWLQKQVDDAERLRERIVTADEKLMPFQVDGVGFLWRNPAAMMFDEQGLGKTVQAVCSIEPERQALVVCPAFLRDVWREACLRWRPDLKPVIVKGKLSAVPEPGEVLIISYESLPPNVHKLHTMYPGTVLIADEAQYLKNYSSTRTQIFRQLARIVKKSGFVWLLTGTPIINEPDDLWAMMQAMSMGSDLYGNREGFDKAFGGFRTVEGMVWGKPKADALDPVRPFYIRRLRLDVLPQLPGKIYSSLPVDVSVPMDMRLIFDDLLAQLEVEVDPSKLTSGNVHTARETLARLKIPAALNFVKNIDRPLIVFSAYKEPVRALSQLTGWRAITGDVAPTVRTAIVRDLQEGKLRGVACTIAAAGLGLTMTRSHDALFVDQEWTDAANVQAEDRLCRIGQNETVQITRLVANHPLDRRVAQLLEAKRRLAAPMSWPNIPVRAVPVEKLKMVIDLLP